ncbi:hypothetical protein MK805_10165 [Shimazuella sp. AN120528]|uniref:hypothetical protein n=1 Tax=Shimazuella soli TaxID=1892854 RepID=UPI001F1031C5|nr:hypothetical protein [Shimazuella soli]MCH5585334.1 hypothetical protein [Shimazuella soli]
MSLKLQIEGDSKVVRDFIHYIRMDERYTFYESAKYVFSPEKDQVEFIFAGRGMDDTSGYETDRERVG